MSNVKLSVFVIVLPRNLQQARPEHTRLFLGIAVRQEVAPNGDVSVDPGVSDGQKWRGTFI